MTWPAYTVGIGLAVAVVLILGGFWLVKELRGVRDPKPNDTYTEWVRPFIRRSKLARFLLYAFGTLLMVLGLGGVAAIVWFLYFHI